MTEYIIMKISEIADILGARVLCCGDKLSSEVHSACGSDMMSDVLAYVKNQAVLITGLVNPQVIRTAEMMDMRCIVFVRRKVPTDGRNVRPCVGCRNRCSRNRYAHV